MHFFHLVSFFKLEKNYKKNAHAIAKNIQILSIKYLRNKNKFNSRILEYSNKKASFYDAFTYIGITYEY